MRFVLSIGLLMAAAACGYKQPTYACPGATVPAAWAEWKLPLDRGKVCTATDRRIEVRFTAGSPDTLYPRFADAATARGFVLDSDAGAPCKANVCGQAFSQGDVHLIVSAVAMDGFQGKPIVVSISK